MKIQLVCAVLFLVCVAYAIVLDKHPHWYLPRNRTWITVVIGNTFIVVAQAALLTWGVAIGIGTIIATNGAAGAPISIWQLVRGAANSAEQRARKRSK